MAKPGLTSITTTDTFQTWLDTTNELISIIKTDTITASSANGDSTSGNATLVGSFTANTIIAMTEIDTNTLKSRTGNNIDISGATLTVTASAVNTVTNSSTLGPRNIFTNGTTDWRIGFSTSSGSAFIIDTGTGTEKLSLTAAGVLSVPSVVATTFTGNLTGAVSGNATTSSALATGRTIGMTGDVTWTSGSFNGSSNVTGTSTIGANKVLDSMLRQSAATSILGRASNSSGNVADISTSTNGQILRRAGDILGFGAIDLANTNAVSNILPVVNGGTGASSFTANKVLLGSGTSAITAQSNLTWDSVNNRFGVNQATPTVALEVTGAILASGEISAFSDERLKTNIKTIDDALNKVLALRGVYFDKDNKKNIGVIAQEVEKIIPEVVSNTGEYKAVAYANIVGLLIESIKELTAKVETLERNKI